ncbi:MAG: DUF4163 domain-containing protein [Erythrobacter sp.]|nr:MAG: DUF4163 domain-containing protein [Erythrobacter sp.]
MLRRFSSILVAAALLSGCDFAGEEPKPAPTATASTPTPDASATGDDAPVGGARQVSEETDTFLFEYAYPAEAGEIPGLAAWLDLRLDRQREALAREASDGRDQARDNGFPFNKYSSGTAWEVVADLPGWLSLSANLDSYQGGAHPNYGFDALVWDKENDRPLEPVSFFASAEALDAALGERLCEALNAERAERRGEPVEEGSDGTFDTCIKPDETNVLLGSSNGRHFDRVGIQIAPYLAGPYAEGAYEFTFEVDDDLLAIVRPEYRVAFGAEE